MKIITRDFVDTALFTHALKCRNIVSIQFGNKLKVIYIPIEVNPTNYAFDNRIYAIYYNLIENNNIDNNILRKYPYHKYLVDLESREIIPMSSQSEVSPILEDEWNKTENYILDMNIFWEMSNNEWIIKYEGTSNGSK